MCFTKRAATICALAFAVLGLSTQPVLAGPIPTDGTWILFEWSNAPGSWVNDTPFIFTSAGVIIVDITDAYAPGDRFRVYNHGILIGDTSQPNVPAHYMTDPNATFVHPGFSSGSFTLPSGAHSITIQVIQIAEGAPNGAGFIRVRSDITLSEVPEPGSMTMAGLGLAGLVYAGYRRWRRRPEMEMQAPVI